MFDIVVERDDDIRVLFPVLRRIREGESLLAEFRLVGNEDVCQLGGSIDIRRILRVDGYAVGHLRRRTVYRVYVFYLGIVVPRGEFFHRQSEYIEYFGVEGSPVVVFGIARVRVDVRILDGLSVVDVPGLLEVLLVFRSDVVFGYFEFDVGVGDCLVIHERVYFEYGGTAYRCGTLCEPLLVHSHDAGLLVERYELLLVGIAVLGRYVRGGFTELVDGFETYGRIGEYLLNLLGIRFHDGVEVD